MLQLLFKYIFIVPLFLRFLIHSYCNQKMRVKWNGSLSGTFSASNGVKLVELVREMLTVVSKSFIVGLIVFYMISKKYHVMLKLNCLTVIV